MTDATFLRITHGVSRGRETYGYNIVTLTDESTGRKFRAMGGGYDMLGTVLADWLTAEHMPRLLTLGARAHSTYVHGAGRVTNDDRSESLYGLSRIVHTDNRVTMSLDGACGENSVRAVMAAIGIGITSTTNRRGHTVGYLVTVSGDDK